MDDNLALVITPSVALPMGRQIIFACNPPGTDFACESPGTNTSACKAPLGQTGFACEPPGTDPPACKAPLGQTDIACKHPQDSGLCLLKPP